ncbi:MAG TPA: glycosyltransferase family 2 protein [Vicinamibacteria bacterium]|nr:glycosyltransferase family 2 protein [Vicinamibacteria bacterium]
MQSPAAEPQLTVVIPAYNEQDAITGVLAEWALELERLGVDYRLAVYDDGSRDGTPGVLSALAERDPRVEVVRQPNRGHGPTILRGYREARSPWVMQVDSDGEMAAAHFGALWHEREGYDFLVGDRRDRESVLVRRIVSAGSRAAVHLLLGRGLRDVNSPYRLLRRAALAPLLELVPEDAFAPNTLRSGLAARAGLRILERPVPHHGRQTGRGSLHPARLARGVARSFADTLTTAVRARRRR